MNQGANSEVVAPPGTTSVENRHIFGTGHGQPSSYLPSSTESEVSSWVTQRINNFTPENGGPSTVSDQHMLPPGSDGLNPPTVASSTSVGPSSATQDYNGYMANSYGYGAPNYTGYYSGYQQNNNPSYSQPTGAYQNTGVPYQPISSFQNTGSYAVPTSYSSTHYNPGDYQTAGGYPSSSYSNQTASWSVGNYANYNNYQYPNYPPTSTVSYAPVSAPAAPSVNYQQQYQQWANYYAQTEVSCAPGTESLSVAGKTNLQSPLSGFTSGYINSNSQQPPTSTPSWRPGSGSSEYPSSQPSTAVSATQDNYWKSGASSLQNHHTSAAQPEYYQPLDPKSTYSSYQDAQKTTYPQAPSLHYTNVLQAPQIQQSPLQTSLSLAAQKVSKVQITTNPRIISNLALGLGKADKAGGTPAAAKPAYVSISVPKPNEGLPSDDASDSTIKPSSFPKSLRGYVERALARCTDDSQKVACQAIMKEVITKATADGTLHMKDWDTEPLFPLPDTSKDSQPAAQASLFKKSPSRRTKSRWEPLPDEKVVDKLAISASDGAKHSGWDNVGLRDRKPFGSESGGKGDRANNTKPYTPNQKIASVQRPFKRQRLSDNFVSTDKDDMSSDSDKEQNLVDYHSGAIALANTPEERKRREERSRRFEKVKGNRADVGNFKSKTGGAVNLYARRATALVLSKNFDDNGSRAVEDIDWDALTVKGTCQEIEKRYLRLTSTPDPATVRPEEVLEKALVMVQNSPKNYLYKCDQLKSIRQDLTVQRIRNQLTVKVYETHARLALENGDLAEYNQCQSQLKILYAEGIDGCHMEFSAYNLLCVILHSNNNRDLLSSMARLSKDAKEDEAVKHALAVRAAVTSGNYVTFFKLYKTAPNLHPCLMDLYVEKMRYKAVNCMARSYRPMVPVSYIAQVLGFASSPSLTEGVEEKELDGIEECVEWLKAHGAILGPDNNGEMQLDAKASSSSLYMPEPEDAVAHGDASLAVNDFLTRAPS